MFFFTNLDQFLAEKEGSRGGPPAGGAADRLHLGAGGGRPHRRLRLGRLRRRQAERNPAWIRGGRHLRLNTNDACVLLDKKRSARSAELRIHTDAYSVF
jgi:hypothetical protein